MPPTGSCWWYRAMAAPPASRRFRHGRIRPGLLAVPRPRLRSPGRQPRRRRGGGGSSAPKYDGKLRGFAQGADDYLTKPFALAELGARCQRGIGLNQRRMAPVARPIKGTAAPGSGCVFRSIPARNAATARDGRPASLRPDQITSSPPTAGLALPLLSKLTPNSAASRLGSLVDNTSVWRI